MSELPMTINCPNEDCDGTIDLDPKQIMEGQSYSCPKCGEKVGLDNSEKKNKEAFTNMVAALKSKKK